MITYIDSNNANKYHILFEKATELFKSKAGDDPNLEELLNPEDIDNFSISSLNEYFAYLQKLVEYAVSDDDKKAFLRLPLDEEVFEINADTREVTVPSNFANNGVGVQGDEMSEIVYFTIDRYFDHTDLANNQMNIAIQWEATNENGESISGFTRNFGKEIIYVNNLPKVIFGWPISHEFTKAPGNVRFAARFYKIENNTITYSLTTLPATVRIYPTLDQDILNNSAIDHGDTITQRVVSFGIYDRNAPIPQAPTITKPLFIREPIVDEDVKIIDLPTPEDDYASIKLAVGAKVTDIGVVGCNWLKASYINGRYVNLGPVPSNEDYVSTIEYMPITPAEYDATYLYYTPNGNGGYRLVDGTITIEEEEDEDTGESIPVGFKENDVVIPLYLKIFQLEIKDTTVDSIGSYTAQLYTQTLMNSIPAELDIDDRIKIPGPMAPEFDVSIFNENSDIVVGADESIHIATDADTYTLNVNAIKAESKEENRAEAGENYHVDLEYQWSEITATDIVPLEDESGTSLELENLTGNFDKEYQVAVTSKRNGATTTKNSGIYRITPKPVAPEIEVQKTFVSSTGPTVRWVSASASEAINSTVGSPINIRVRPLTQTDKVYYLWMYHERENAPIDIYDENETDAALARINVELNKIFNDNAQEGKDTIIEALTQFDTLTNTESGDFYVSSYTPTTAEHGAGIYYCIVINELNEHINASIVLAKVTP